MQYQRSGIQSWLCLQFFAKCGILKEDDDGKPRVKLYQDRASGMLKGDGLVYYLKQPSVSHHIDMLSVAWCNSKIHQHMPHWELDNVINSTPKHMMPAVHQ